MDEEERFTEKVGMAAARNGFGDCRPAAPAAEDDCDRADWADWGGVAETDALLDPCITSSAISVTGSFSGTFGADSVSYR